MASCYFQNKQRSGHKEIKSILSEPETQGLFYNLGKRFQWRKLWRKVKESTVGRRWKSCHPFLWKSQEAQKVFTVGDMYIQFWVHFLFQQILSLQYFFINFPYKWVCVMIPILHFIYSSRSIVQVMTWDLNPWKKEIYLDYLAIDELMG